MASLLEFIFHLCLLTFSPLMSMKDLVPGIKSLLQLNQAKSLTPTEYGDNPLNDLLLFLSLWSSMSAGDFCRYRLKWYSSFLTPSYPCKWCLPYLCIFPWDVSWKATSLSTWHKTWRAPILFASAIKFSLKYSLDNLVVDLFGSFTNTASNSGNGKVIPHSLFLFLPLQALFVFV